MSARLEPILASARRRVEELLARGDGEDLRARARERAPARDFVGALRRQAKDGATPGPLRVIGELKRRSPSAGAIRPDLDPQSAALELEAAGVSALSVLTEPEFFGGSLDFLEGVRERVHLPLLRKDFLLDPAQVVEARAHGADAILLLAVALDDDSLRGLAEVAFELGLHVLAEAHDLEELDRLLSLDLPVDLCAIGVNARDLRSFEVDLRVGLDLAEEIPSAWVAVAESGVRTPEDARLVAAARVDATLCGEGLMRGGRLSENFNRLFGQIDGGSGTPG